MTDKIIVEIKDPFIKSEQKFDAAVRELQKALRLVHEEKTEPTPYRALAELADYTRALITSGLRLIFNNIVTTWLRLPLSKSFEYDYYDSLFKARAEEPFQLNGKTYINPRTGMPLTNADYEQITKDLERCFGYLYQGADDFLVKQAIALGRILNSMDPDRAINISYDDARRIFESQFVTPQEIDSAAQAFAYQETGQMLQDISMQARRKVVGTIIDAQKNRLSARELESNLFDSFDDLNRDWRRVAETETANNFNNGYLEATLKKNEVGKTIFMRGITGAGACSWCENNIKRQVVVLLDAAPSGGDDSIMVDGRSYTAIWPGKSNYGRKRAEWWVAAGTQHPHCRCTWLPHTPGFEEADQRFYEAMDRLAATANRQQPRSQL